MQKYNLTKIFNKDIIKTDIIKGQTKYSIPEYIDTHNFHGYTFNNYLFIKKPRYTIRDGLRLVVTYKKNNIKTGFIF